MNSLTEWAEGVPNKADLHVERYGEYQSKTIESPGNLSDMQQMLRDVTWQSVLLALRTRRSPMATLSPEVLSIAAALWPNNAQ